MKLYTKQIEDPYTNLKEEISVKEYDYNDWVNGIIPTNFKHGEILYENGLTNEVHCEILPYAEKVKILNKAKELYSERVSHLTEIFRIQFLQRYKKSQAKKLLVDGEIETYNELLFNKLLPISEEEDLPNLEITFPGMNPIDFKAYFKSDGKFNVVTEGGMKINYTSHQIGRTEIIDIRNIYKRLIIEGIKNYSNFNPHSYGHMDIKVEAIHNYYEWLKIHSSSIVLNDIGSVSEEESKVNPKTDQLKMKQIALIHAFNGKQITRDNAAEIANKNKYIAKTSGESLYQDYCLFSSSANRKGRPHPFTKKKLDNKIKLFQSVLEHLNPKGLQRAKDEIETLKTLYNHEDL